MKQFLPFLTDDKGKSLTLQGGVVVKKSTPNPLFNSPEGWEKNVIQFSRNSEFLGIIVAYTTSLKFYLDGARILRDIFYRQGMETVIYFVWLKQNVTFGAGMKYEGWYKGEPDFSTFKDEYDGVEINIAEGGVYKDIQINKSTTTGIPFDENSGFLYMDGLNIYQKLSYTDLLDFTIDIKTFSQRFLGGMNLSSQEGASSGILIGSETLDEVGTDFATLLKTSNTMLVNTGAVPVVFHITGRISFTCTKMVSSPPYAMRFRFLTSTMTLADQSNYDIIITDAMNVGATYAQDFSFDITLQPKESLIREGIFFGGPGVDAGIKFNADSKFDINFTTRNVPSIIKVDRAYDMGKKLMNFVSPGSDFKSPLLENDFNLLITSGDALRGFSDAQVKTNLSDYYKSIDAVKCAAMQVVDNVPYLYSRYDKFDKNQTIAALGECSKWSLEVATDYVYDKFEAGYPAKSSAAYSDVNGKYSFNNTSTWKVDITRRIDKTYSAKAVYYADPFDIELTRLNLDGKDTTSANTDNSVFFIDGEKRQESFAGSIQVYSGNGNVISLNGDASAFSKFLTPGTKFQLHGGSNDGMIFTVVSFEGWNISGHDGWVSITVTEKPKVDETFTGSVTFTNLYQLRRKTYTTIEGIPNDGTVFNLELSPARIFRNHWRWIRSSCDHLDANTVIFLTADKNPNLKTVDTDGNVIQENANIQVKDMGEKVFLPYYVIFQILSPDNLLALMKANSSGKFTYTIDGAEYTGFPWDIKTNDTTLETQEYKLLQTALDNNLTLIR